MIGLITIIGLMLGFAFFCASCEYSSFPLLLLSMVAVGFVIFSQAIFYNSNYSTIEEAQYKVQIAGNGIAYIFPDGNSVNVNYVMNRNFKEGDIVTVKEYKSYWAGYIWVEGKVEYFLGE